MTDTVAVPENTDLNHSVLDIVVNPLDQSINQSIQQIDNNEDVRNELQSPTIQQPDITQTNQFYYQLDYYMRYKQYNHSLQYCIQYTQNQIDRINNKTSINKNIVMFWCAIITGIQGNCMESLRELNTLDNSTVPQLALTSALISIYKQTNTTQNSDTSKIDALKIRLKELSKSNDIAELMYGARYFLYTQKYKQCKQCIDKILSQNKRNIEALILLGYVSMYSNEQRQQSKAYDYFTAAIKQTSKLHGTVDCNALFGRALYYESKQQYNKSIDDLNSIISVLGAQQSRYVSSERCRLMYLNHDIDQCMATINQLNHNSYNDCVLCIVQIQHVLSYSSSNTKLITSCISSYIDYLNKLEPTNHLLYYSIVRYILQYSQSNPQILQQCVTVIDIAIKLTNSSNYLYLCEKASIQYYLHQYNESYQLYQQCSINDNTMIEPVIGQIKCLIALKKLDQANDLLQDLDVIQHSNEQQSITYDSIQLKYLHSLVLYQSTSSIQLQQVQQLCHDTIKQFNQYIETTIESSNTLVLEPIELTYYTAHNPLFVGELVSLLLLVTPVTPCSTVDESESGLLSNCIKLLNRIVQFDVCNTTLVTLLSRCYYISSAIDSAERVLNQLQHLSEQQINDANIYILYAQLCVHKQQFKQVSIYIDNARSINFSIRNTVQYHLIKTYLLIQNQQFNDAINVLIAALELPTNKNDVNVYERIELHTMLITLYIQTQQLSLANQQLTTLKTQYKPYGNDVQQLLTLYECDVLLAKHDTDHALRLLTRLNCTAEHIFYLAIQIKKSTIYLKHKRNTKLYIQCYHDVVASRGTSIGTLTMLAQAYINIQQHTNAVHTYEQCLSIDPTNLYCTNALGTLLVQQHDYARAVEYYENVIEQAKSNDNNVYVTIELYHNLTKLYVQLKHYDEAIQILNNVLTLIANQFNTSDVHLVQGNVVSYTLLADVYETIELYDKLIDSLNLAYQSQCQLSGNDEYTATAAALAYRIALYYQTYMNDETNTVSYIKQCLQHNPNHTNALLLLAKLSYQNGAVSECERYCYEIMKIDPYHTETIQLLANLLVQKNDINGAIQQYSALVVHPPYSLHALAALVQLMNRVGQLSQCKQYIEIATKHYTSNNLHLQHCSAIYEMYNHNVTAALQLFNQCKHSPEHQISSLQYMISLYIQTRSYQWYRLIGDDAEQRLQSAQSLLNELELCMASRVGLDRIGLTIQQCYIELYQYRVNNKSIQLDSILDKLQHILHDVHDHIPAILCYAYTQLVRNDIKQAKLRLKSIVQLKHNLTYLHEIECATLLLAELYIDTTKYDTAIQLCESVIKYNKSNISTYELLGGIYEKQVQYESAVQSYSVCWNNNNHSLTPHNTQSSNIGYKLAYNLFKCKRYIETCVICQQLIVIQPDITAKLKKEIWNKARAEIRP